jgi:hypothetical protein
MAGFPSGGGKWMAHTYPIAAGLESRSGSEGPAPAFLEIPRAPCHI